MQLFDDFERTEPYPQGRSIFDTYNLSSYPDVATQRDSCNDWFSRFPSRGQSDLRKWFRSDEDKTHRSAWFELLLHEALNRLGCSLTHHPTDSNTSRRPDFLVSGKDKDCYLEATVIFSSAADRRVTKQEERFLKLIDELESPNFMLFPHLTGELYTDPEEDQSIDEVRSFLEEHNPENVKRLVDDGGARPSLTFTVGDWTLELDLVPRDFPSPVGSTIPFTPMATATLDAVDNLIADKVIRKIVGKDCDKLSRPLVVAAVLPSLAVALPLEALPQLLGPLVLPRVVDGTTYARGGEWVWIDAEGDERFENCHAVWLFPDAWALGPSVPQNYKPWLFLNPLVEVALPDELLGVSHIRLVNGQPPQIVEGVDLSQLLS